MISVSGSFGTHRTLPSTSTMVEVSLAPVARVVILDYGSGNLRSAERALRRVGADVLVTSDHQAALDCAGLVVPGVGAFAAVMAGLRGVRGDRIIGKRL